MIVNVDETYDLLSESRVLVSKDDNSVHNKFMISNRPQGIILTDTVNNPFFPMSKPSIDTAKFDLPEIYRQYRELYSQGKSLYLPFHYVIELIGKQYFIFNTRPIDMKFPIDTNLAEANHKQLDNTWDEVTNVFFKYKLFDVSEAIHICLIGNSNLDVYTNVVYRLIGSSCMLPILKQSKIHGKLYQNVFCLNIGKRFNFNLMSKFITI